MFWGELFHVDIAVFILFNIGLSVVIVWPLFFFIHSNLSVYYIIIQKTEIKQFNNNCIVGVKGLPAQKVSHTVCLLPLTHSHHVVPAVQVTQVEPLPVRRGGCDEYRDVPVAVLQDTHRPRTQEPADRHQHHSQNPQQVEAGHVGHSLGRAWEEHLQHPV